MSKHEERVRSTIDMKPTKWLVGEPHMIFLDKTPLNQFMVSVYSEDEMLLEQYEGSDLLEALKMAEFLQEIYYDSHECGIMLNGFGPGPIPIEGVKRND